ncbi:MAG: Holliday junction resolvase RuvX [Dehalococcoidales bacterium]|nr:Holliday junction resolvase RuvX [Dehalococcoidales bacterium]
MRSLGLDVGDKRIGVALSDPGGILATPLTIIHCTETEADLQVIVTLVKKHDVGHIIVGLPLALDGSISSQAEKVKLFTDDLRSHTEIPIEFRDERLSTVSAKRMMRGVRQVSKNGHDAIAAALILQSYLDEASMSDIPQEI